MSPLDLGEFESNKVLMFSLHFLFQLHKKIPRIIFYTLYECLIFFIKLWYMLMLLIICEVLKIILIKMYYNFIIKIYKNCEL